MKYVIPFVYGMLILGILVQCGSTPTEAGEPLEDASDGPKITSLKVDKKEILTVEAVQATKGPDALSEYDEALLNAEHCSFYDTGQTKKKRCKLNQSMNIQSYPCLKDQYIAFYEDGTLQSFVLWENTTIQQVTLPYQTLINMDPQGKLDNFYLPEDFYIQSLPCKADRFTTVYENGKLHTLWLAQITEIQSIPCDMNWVQLHADGSLQSCYLAKNTDIKGQTYSIGSNICLTAQGEVGDCSTMIP